MMATVTLPMALLPGGIPGWGELLIVAMVGLIFFGRRLPEVGRSIGKTIVEFRKGIQDVKDDIDTSSQPPAKPPAPLEHQQSPTLPSGADAPASSTADEKRPAEQSP